MPCGLAGAGQDKNLWIRVIRVIRVQTLLFQLLFRTFVQKMLVLSS
jgi:hypothetical protein